MRILIATGLYPPESGGPATYSALVKEKLPAFGFTVVVLPFRVVRHLPPVLRHAVYFFKALSTPADIVYAQDTVSVGLPAALGALLSGRTFVVRVPGDYAWEQGRQRFGVVDELDDFQKKSYGIRVGILRAIQKFVVRRARAVVVPSEYMKRIVCGWGAACVHVIYSSIKTPVPVPVERPEGFLVVSFGRNVPWKGFDALRKVAEQEPRWHLTIFHDLPRGEAMGWLKAADVYVNNSTYEGLSHQLVEALSLGTPVVATNVGGNPEVVGEAGLLVPPNDDRALYQALKHIEQDRVSAAARAAQGLARAKLFNIDTAVSQLAELLKMI